MTLNTMPRKYNSGKISPSILIGGVTVLLVVIISCLWFVPLSKVSYTASILSGGESVFNENTKKVEEIIKIPSHVSTPDAVKAIYMTACVGGTPSLRNKLIALFQDTELNSLVLDLKDYTGTISYSSTGVDAPSNGKGCRILDLPDFISELHSKGIYVIARITVFQDPLYASTHPALAVQSLSKPDGIWRDKNQLAYIDPGATEYWDYIVAIAKEAYAIGFDEINFDYIRFPSDGNLADAKYAHSMGRPKREVLRDFFSYLDSQLASTTVPISADLFGLTTSSYDDLGIGQVIEVAFPYFDYIAPMVYPSHFAKGYMGMEKPATQPYAVIHASMSAAVKRALIASTSPQKLRPWIQDFDLGADYTPEMVRAQLQATYDVGLTSWMIWNASNVYQKSALLGKDVIDNVAIIKPLVPFQTLASSTPVAELSTSTKVH